MVSVHDPDREAAFGELADAVLCTDSPVRSLVGLSQSPEHRRRHSALYDGVNHGRIDITRLRNLIGAQRLPRETDGRSC